MSQLLEDYILHHLNNYDEIAEKRPLHDQISERRKRKRVEGAFVLEPKAGLYENLAIFDTEEHKDNNGSSFLAITISIFADKESKDFAEETMLRDDPRMKIYLS